MLALESDVLCIEDEVNWRVVTIGGGAGLSGCSMYFLSVLVKKN